MASMIRTNGTVAQTPRYVARAINNHRGRVLNVRDNFPHLDGGDDTMSTVIVREVLKNGAGYVPALEGNGFRLAGPWRKLSDGSYTAVVERI